MNRHYDGVYDHRALAQEALGDLDGAISTLEQAVAYEAPWDPEVHTRQKERLAGLRARKVEEQGCSSPSSRPANSASATGRIVIPVSDAEELQAAAARIASSPSVPYKIQIAGGEYEIPGEDVPGVGMAIVIGGDDVVLEGIGMNRQSSVKRGEDKSKNSQERQSTGDGLAEVRDGRPHLHERNICPGASVPGSVQTRACGREQECAERGRVRARAMPHSPAGRLRGLWRQ
jgi:hypothetical protein